MKKVELKSLKLTNFKGQRNLSIDFKDSTTNIFGDNGEGKTTIFDAVEWLRSGKDSTDRTNFEIKTLDKNNKVIPKIEHEVVATYHVDGEVVTMKRVLVENWVKKKGEEQAEFTGNITKYFWNDVPKQQKEFNELVGGILDETIFKLITNPLAFNNDKTLPWEKRREVLTKLAGEIKMETLAEGNKEYMDLLAKLTQGKTLVEYKKQIVASIVKAKLELKAIPTRIDEATKMKPQSHDFDQLKILLKIKEDELEKVENLITNKSAAFDDLIQSNGKIKMKIAAITDEVFAIRRNTEAAIVSNEKPAVVDHSAFNAITAQIEEKEGALASAERTLATIQGMMETKNAEITAIGGDVIKKRAEWIAENAAELVINDDSFHCPTCKRDFESGDVEAKKAEMKTNFMKAKQEKLAAINIHGAALKASNENMMAELEVFKTRAEKGGKVIEYLKVEIDELTIKKETEKAKIEIPQPEASAAINVEEVLKTKLAENESYQLKVLEIQELTKTIQDLPQTNTAEFDEKKILFKNEIEEIKTKLRNETQINLIDQRIKDLLKEEKDLAGQISSVEKEQFTIENFNKLRIETIENEVNSKFKFVNFRMFSTQVNGGETECCDALIDGVPFSDANNAAKINAGLDIINTLCEFYQVSAPIFIDNRESVVNLLPTKSQVINLIVEEGSKLSVGAPNYTAEFLVKKAKLETA